MKVRPFSALEQFFRKCSCPCPDDILFQSPLPVGTRCAVCRKEIEPAARYFYFREVDAVCCSKPCSDRFSVTGGQLG